MRCFVACFVATDSALRLRALCPPLADARLVPADNLHLTLHFIGHVGAERMDELRSLAADLPRLDTTASVVAVTGFPSPARARVVVARLDADPALLRWHRELHERWPTAEKDRLFDAHVTLARSRRGVRIAESIVTPPLQIELGAPDVFVSETLPEGARYRRLSASGA